MRIEGVNPGEYPDYIIVGLGNHGNVYDETRHNIGFKAIKYVNKFTGCGVGIKRAMHHSLIDKCVLGGNIVIMMQPQTYMNNSGMAVKDAMDYYRMKPDQLIVIHDDINLPCDRLKVKVGGSCCGHPGLKSIVEHIGTKDFIRIRVGAGVKPVGTPSTEFRMSRITTEEKKMIYANFEEVRNAISFIFKYSVDYAINYYNYVPPEDENEENLNKEPLPHEEYFRSIFRRY